MLKFGQASSIGCMNKGEFGKDGNLASILPIKSGVQCTTVGSHRGLVRGGTGESYIHLVECDDNNTGQQITNNFLCL